jgi:hypothetical protein
MCARRARRACGVNGIPCHRRPLSHADNGGAWAGFQHRRCWQGACLRAPLRTDGNGCQTQLSAPRRGCRAGSRPGATPDGGGVRTRRASGGKRVARNQHHWSALRKRAEKLFIAMRILQSAAIAHGILPCVIPASSRPPGGIAARRPPCRSGSRRMSHGAADAGGRQACRRGWHAGDGMRGPV